MMIVLVMSSHTDDEKKVKLRDMDALWSDIWNISYVELRIWNQVSYDHRSYERNLSVYKPEKVRTSTGLEPVALFLYAIA